MSHYRDPLAGLRGQIVAKRGLLVAREEALVPVLRLLLPPVVQAALEDESARLAAGEPIETASVEQLTRADAALDLLLDAFERAAALLPKARECPDEVAEPSRGQLQPPWIFEERDQLQFRADFTRRLGEIEPDADVVRWGDTTYLSRFRVAGMPVVLAARYEPIGVGAPVYESHLRTSVPRAFPTVRVRRATPIVDSALGLVGLVRDVKLGEASFDADFVVDAVRAAAGVLTADVRRALHALGTMKPKLSVERGIAELTWEGTYVGRATNLVPDEAFAAVLGVRAAIERA